MFQEEMAQNGQNRAILANFQAKDPFEQPVKKEKKGKKGHFRMGMGSTAL